MKLSLNWIKEFVSLPADLTPEQLAYDLTMTTVEVEGHESLASSVAGMLVGKIQSMRQHPNADRLTVVMAEVGEETKQIVCGGSNLREGMLVAIAPPGAKVRWHGEGDLVELKETKLRGEESWGMICASDEIGLAELFPKKAEKEIVDLSALGVPAGTTLADALQLTDVIIEIDNKSLTNRPDLWGHYGIARELAAIYNVPLKPLPQGHLPKEAGKIRAQIDAPDLCRRYTALVVEGMKPGSSPEWMQRRLASLGQRPISLAVDLTNYVMLAIGQPTHAFDARELSSDTIYIRRAKEKESIELLDGKKIELTSDVLVIADQKCPVALAGVMGGKDSGVRSDTETVILESASFDSVNVRRTATRYGLRTESSMRFDKGIDCERAAAATELFLSLLKEIQPQAKGTAYIDSYPRPFEKLEIPVEASFISGRIGKDFTSKEISELLERFGYEIQTKGDSLKVSVPSFRATGDISLPDDLVEEVARLYGYDKLEFVAPPVLLNSAVRQLRYDLDKQLREFLAYSAGFSEVFNYPWVDARLRDAAGNTDASLELQDPPSPDLASIVTSLIPNLLGSVERNIRNESAFGLFEVARVFRAKDFAAWSVEKESLPVQPKMVAGILVLSDPKEAFLKLKGVLESLFSFLAIEKLTFRTSGDFSAWSRDAQLAIVSRGKQIGEFGLVTPKVCRAIGAERSALAAFEFSFDELKELAAPKVDYQTIPKFPQVEFDLSMLFDVETPWEKIQQVSAASDKRVRRVRFVDEYQGEQIPTGKRSVAFQMTFGDPEKTLTSEETQAIALAVMSSLEKKAGAQKREK